MYTVNIAEKSQHFTLWADGPIDGRTDWWMLDIYTVDNSSEYKHGEEQMNTTTDVNIAQALATKHIFHLDMLISKKII